MWLVVGLGNPGPRSTSATATTSVSGSSTSWPRARGSRPRATSSAPSCRDRARGRTRRPLQAAGVHERQRSGRRQRTRAFHKIARGADDRRARRDRPALRRASSSAGRRRTAATTGCARSSRSSARRLRAGSLRRRSADRPRWQGAGHVLGGFTGGAERTAARSSAARRRGRGDPDARPAGRDEQVQHETEMNEDEQDSGRRRVMVTRTRPVSLPVATRTTPEGDRMAIQRLSAETAGHAAGVRNDLHPAPGHHQRRHRPVNTRVRGVIEPIGGTSSSSTTGASASSPTRSSKQLKGIYLYWQYLGSTGLVEEIERNLRMLDPVIRYYTVKIDENVDPTARRASRRRDLQQGRDAGSRRGRAGDGRRALALRGGRGAFDLDDVFGGVDEPLRSSKRKE